jgi:hypothetical protein
MHRHQKARAETVAAESAPIDNQTQANFSSDPLGMQSALPNVQDIADGSAFLQVLTRIAVALEQQNSHLIGINLTIQYVGRYL